jgi:hypothetical protein
VTQGGMDELLNENKNWLAKRESGNYRWKWKANCIELYKCKIAIVK